MSSSRRDGCAKTFQYVQVGTVFIRAETAYVVTAPEIPKIDTEYLAKEFRLIAKHSQEAFDVPPRHDQLSHDGLLNNFSKTFVDQSKIKDVRSAEHVGSYHFKEFGWKAEHSVVLDKVGVDFVQQRRCIVLVAILGVFGAEFWYRGFPRERWCLNSVCGTRYASLPGTRAEWRHRRHRGMKRVRCGLGG